jgi:hypothetical protein
METYREDKTKPNDGIVDNVALALSGVPRIILFSVCGVLIARYICHLPVEQMAAGVGAPLLSIILIQLIFPAQTNRSVNTAGSTASAPGLQPRQPVWLAVLGIVAAFSLLFGMVSLMSAGLYRWIGLISFAETSLRCAVMALIVLVFAFVFLVLTGALPGWGIARKVFWEIPRSIAGHLSHLDAHGTTGR